MTEEKIKNKEEKKTRKRINKVPDKKKKEVDNLVDLINKNNTTMVVSSESISAMQFRKIKYILKEKAIIKIIKKTLFLRALEKAEKTKTGVESLRNFLEKNFAVIFSNIDPFELASILSENKFPAKIKAGQIAIKDISLDAGATDLPAGPAISELSKLGVKTKIENGKIFIKEKCTLVKEGDKISKDAASILTKLEISVFSLGLDPIAAYDSKKKKIYENIKVDKEEMIKDIKELKLKAVNLAVNLRYPCKETISQLILIASQEANNLSKLI